VIKIIWAVQKLGQDSPDIGPKSLLTVACPHERKGTLYSEMIRSFGTEDDIEVKKTSDPVCCIDDFKADIKINVGVGGGAFFEVLRCKSEDGGFDSRWGHWDFPLT